MTTAVLTARPAARGGFRPRGIAWLIWRQNRIMFAVLTIGFAALVVYLLHERSALDTAVARVQALHCNSTQPYSPACGDADMAQYAIPEAWHQTMFGLALLPGVFGAVLGAQPLATDFERRRTLLLWSQSVSPRRWLTYRLALPSAVLLVLSTALSVTVRWGGFWSRPPVHLASWGSGEDFMALVPLYPLLTLAAFALGALVGLLLHRPIAALGVTFILYAGLLWSLDVVRPYLLPSYSMVERPGWNQPDGAWVFDIGVVLGGKQVPYSQCPDMGCGDVPNWVRFHLISQFGPMLWIETGILAALTGLLVLACYRRLRALTR
ncbi:hypothetical protein [Streptacidiphilus jiangxiensis]|uniref:ABC-2 family transporter protein n=1 Tax=Streptacidiphilus jiangxiensis TaxID=235985 RepID=A0A1H7WT01_STRJI|nr:hypothetical protein [Streptacidiphilus jiangxiensis]SEM24504.1 hypothetical protein SAMN05414137_121113 [Streptacidiphilus jiangxiensis]